MSRGLARQRSKEDDNAISDFNEAIKINPTDTQALNARGNSYLSLGQYDRAIEDYRQAVELNPRFVPAFFNLGLAYSTTRDFSRALDAYSQAIRIDPKNVGALNNRCYVDIMINDYDAAIRDCGEAVRLDPNHINSYLGLGNAYALLAAKQQKAPTLVSTGGAFAGYLVLFAAMIPYDIVGDFLHPYWTIRGQISLHDRDGKEIHQQALFKQITHRTHPEMNFFEDPTFVIGLPEAEKDFPDVVLEIPNWGVGVLSIRSHKNTRDEFRKIIQLQTPLIINENAHYVSSDSRPQ